MAKKREAVKPPDKSTSSRDTRTTAALVPVRRVDGALIERTDGGFACLITVQGILFDLLAPDEKDLILERYEQALFMINTPFQIVIQSVRVRLDPEIARFQGVQAQYAGDPLPAYARDIAALLASSTTDLEQSLYVFVATGSTEAQARREADTIINALHSVHPDLHPELPDTEGTVAILAQCFGEDPDQGLGRYLPPWEGGMNA